MKIFFDACPVKMTVDKLTVKIMYLSNVVYWKITNFISDKKIDELIIISGIVGSEAVSLR